MSSLALFGLFLIIFWSFVWAFAAEPKAIEVDGYSFNLQHAIENLEKMIRKDTRKKRQLKPWIMKPHRKRRKVERW